MSDRFRFERSKNFTRAIEALVPGGAHTYSKGSDQFPVDAPNGIVRGQGARIWDQDGNCLVDYGMGLTSVSLGHGHPQVVEAVCAAIKDGVNFPRPAALELQAARTFLDYTGGDMVKFAKHGSSVTTAAVKLARAYTGRSKVAVPRQHPFFSFDDWFIGTTPADFGIPEILKQFTLLFDYNDLDSLEALFRAHPDEIAAVMMEPVKFDEPVPGFLEGVRGLCTEQGTVFILDEMVSGMKWGVPGAARFFDIEPDLSTWGKGLSNGFGFAAVTGKGDIMRRGGLKPEGARKLFLLSTTHGAESSGLAAMMKTVELYQDGKLIAANWETGRVLRRRLEEVIARHGLGETLSIIGYPCLMAMVVRNPDGRPDDAFRTLLMQELLAHGVFFQGLFCITPAHGDAEIADTVAAFDAAAPLMRRAAEQGSVEGLLLGPAAKPVFRRVL